MEKKFLSLSHQSQMKKKNKNDPPFAHNLMYRHIVYYQNKKGGKIKWHVDVIQDAIMAVGEIITTAEEIPVIRQDTELVIRQANVQDINLDMKKVIVQDSLQIMAVDVEKLFQNQEIQDVDAIN